MRLTTRNSLTAAVAATAALLASIALHWGLPEATGQQPSPVTPELSAVLARSSPAERIPVLIELRSEAVPRPLSFTRPLRAAEHASNLHDRYSGSADGLARRLPVGLGVDLQLGRVLWIGGALAVELTPEQIDELQRAESVSRLYYDGLMRVELAGESGREPLIWAPGLPASLQDPAGGLPWGLEAIKAPALWQSGATGEGTVVAIIDSGADGGHPLLRRKWRGLTTSPEAAWFDPWGLTTTPVDDDATGGIGHGTIVTTVAVGSLEPGDTLVRFGQPEVVQEPLQVVTGVAPGAEWVAANAFQLFGGGTYTRLSVLLQSMQWVLDPDGDPATVSDIPNVLNNSWGFRSGGCDGVFDRAIDALELGGVPVVFAAGNRGAGFDTVAAPAERADMLLNAFSVGSAQERDGAIVVADNSLGGPTPCAAGSVKPEVVAPGNIPLVRNGGPNLGVVQGLTGPFTSWAAPHVSGSLAILAGLNPGASANDLKAALFSTAIDLPPPGPDNRSGGGFIDLLAAAEAVGGLGGVNLRVASWSWDAANRTLTLRLLNEGVAPFPGGSAELRRQDGVALARTEAPAIRSRGRAEIAFAELPADLLRAPRLRLRLSSAGSELQLPIALRAATASAVTLNSGEVRFSLDSQGRLGRVADLPGFEFLGRDWLTAGALLVGRGMRVSDAAYVDVLQQPPLKANPIGSDTDWRAIDAGASAVVPDMAYSDDRALHPLGATIHQWVDLNSLNDSSVFAALQIAVFLDDPGEPVLAGLFLDWDLAGRDSVGWDSELAASVMTAADSAGPWMALTLAPRAPTTHAAVPLGTPLNGFYEPSTNGGLLARLEGFGDDVKANLLRLGGLQASAAATADWSQMLAAGPVRSGDVNTFLIAAAASRDGLRIALDSARAFAARSAPGSTPELSGLDLQPPFPNPFDPTAGQVVTLPFLINRGAQAEQATLEIFTIAGQRIHRQTRELSPGEPLRPFSWSGILDDGRPAASGVYGYVIRVGRERRSGRFVLLK